MTPSMGFAPVRRSRLSDELVERILTSIAAGDLRPGDRLPPIAQMARGFRVAANTVREALIRLETRRAIEIRQGTGVFIASGARDG